MAHAWNACWVHALRGSNPLSSAKRNAPEKSGAFLRLWPGLRRFVQNGHGAGRKIQRKSENRQAQKLLEKNVMPVEISEIAVDCGNPMLVARFWCEVLDYRVLEEAVGIVSIARVPRRPGEPILCFAQVPEDKTIKNRLHLDVRPSSSTQQEEVDRLLALGANYADVGQSDDDNWVVLMDPEGNEFCVLSGSI